MKNKAKEIKYFPLASFINRNYNMQLKTGFTVEVDPRQQLPHRKDTLAWSDGSV